MERIMRDLYIGGSRRAKRGGFKWKLYMFLFLFLLVTGTVLKLSAPLIVEKWVNKQGSGKLGYAYIIREVEFSLKEGEMTLRDVKVFNPKTKVELVESPKVILKMDVLAVLRGEDKRLDISADKLDVFLSSDLNSEIIRMRDSKDIKKLYFSVIEGKFAKLNFIEKKADMSRTIVQFNDVNLNMKEISPMSVNKRTEFSLNSKMTDGGKINLKGRMNEEEGRRFWTIEGALNEFSPDLFNKIAGVELPFSFNESALNAEITAKSDNGKITGEISPDVRKVNLITERPGFERQVIPRALNEDLTFSLPFTLKDDLTIEYAATFKKLKEYRKYPLTSVVSSESKNRNEVN